MGAGGSVQQFEQEQKITLTTEQRERLQTLYNQHQSEDHLTVSQLLSTYSDSEISIEEKQYKAFIAKSVAKEICKRAIQDAIFDLTSGTTTTTPPSTTSSSSTTTAASKTSTPNSNNHNLTAGSKTHKK